MLSVNIELLSESFHRFPVSGKRKTAILKSVEVELYSLLQRELLPLQICQQSLGYLIKSL